MAVLLVLLLTVAVLLGAAALSAALDRSSAAAAARHFYGDDPSELALARAVAAGNSARVARLVEEGADPDGVGADDITMLQFAIETRSPDGLRALLEAGALRDRLGRAGRAPLHDAARLTDPRYATILLEAGADPDVRVAVTGTTPLREACLAAASETFEALIDGGAEVNAADAHGDRALHVCARADTGALVLRLLDLGADPAARNTGGTTFQDYYFSFHASLLSPAARRDHHRVAVWLEQHHVALVAGADGYR
jgi:ankyrin repeat protein